MIVRSTACALAGGVVLVLLGACSAGTQVEGVKFTATPSPSAATLQATGQGGLAVRLVPPVTTAAVGQEITLDVEYADGHGGLVGTVEDFGDGGIGGMKVSDCRESESNPSSGTSSCVTRGPHRHLPGVRVRHDVVLRARSGGRHRDGRGHRPLTAAGRSGLLPIAWTPPSTWIISPVVAGNQSDSSAQQARAVGSASRTSQPSGARSSQVPRTSRTPGCSSPPWCGSGRPPRRWRGCRAPQVAGQVPGRGLERRLRDPHPVVDRPGEAGVEGQTDDAAAAGHHRQCRCRNGLEGVGADMQRRGHVLPRRVHEARSAPWGAKPIECSTPSRPSRCSESRSANGARCCASVTSSSTTGGVVGSRRAIAGDLHGAAERSEHDLGALVLCELRDVERDRGVGQDAGDQQSLAFEEPLVSAPFPVRRRPAGPLR